MHALVVADRSPAALQPLLRARCAALLPVVAKPLVVHAVETLAAAGVSRLTVAISPFAELVEAELGNGRRWGVAIDYALTPGDEALELLVARLSTTRLGARWIVVHADVLATPCLPAFLRAAHALDAPHVRALDADGVPLGWHVMTQADGAEPLDARIEEARALPVRTCAELHRANVEAAAGRIPGLVLPGRDVAPGLRAGSHGRVPPGCVADGPVFAGARCRVRDGARLHAGTVLADDVLVDRRAVLARAVVLPDTYVGELVELHDAIVAGGTLVRVDTGVVVDVTDALLLADLREQPLGRGLRRALDRALGVALLALSLPLWPAMLVAALAADPRRPFERVRLRGNRARPGGAAAREFACVQARTPIPVLRHLPRLLAVVSGDLALVGTRPLAPEADERRRDDWERRRDEAPVGLVGPFVLETTPGADETEQLVADALYAHRRSLLADLRWMGRGLGRLFSPRAWMR